MVKKYVKTTKSKCKDCNEPNYRGLIPQPPPKMDNKIREKDVFEMSSNKSKKKKTTYRKK
tara:strand:+ start:2076 stop:2255 length:180 start_codon:yes stop_codon:yes gene_type:complete